MADLLHDSSIVDCGIPAEFRSQFRCGEPVVRCYQGQGGQGLPPSLAKIISEMLCAANMGFALYTSAIPGAIATLKRYGTEEQRAQYEAPLVSGRWNATMCLTEPHCGTDLGLLRTRAERHPDGSYRISGTKIFITGGEHDLTEKIVHLVLARLDDAPGGVAGISLFIVPKRLADRATTRNAVSCGAIEKKMGVKASATCVMNFDGATGYLLGEENRGLAAMFTFINASRISAACQGAAHAELGFQKSLAYARERLQSRAPSGIKHAELPADPIIVHPDVRRMLLTQKAFAEGNRLFNHFLAMQLDLVGEGGTASRAAQHRLDLLTPVAKAFATETCVEAADLAVQCFGGHGYIREWGVEQNLRDARIATIYEGTTGVQALDLLRRKVLGSARPALIEFLETIRAFARDREHPQALDWMSETLLDRLSVWQELTTLVEERAALDANEIGAASVSYLMFCGYVILAYFWARSAQVAATALAANTAEPAFYRSKLATAQFYFDHLLPRTEALAASIRAGSRSMMSLAPEEF
ncbi:MAG: acyl-CoA dehydrogenase C-terminal domain-containing protein [Chromatiales bacterium]|nr:acyl-CoA dehydrogenase C-terminal domain-containing protein [Halieaceae bacterium]MCP5353480.1 acyl-CoA dehydrogenase C-terminal domain-containing protein [Chromatiales bacterium]